MTIHELLQAAGLTANDEIPIWDADGTGEPTKKITAQQLAAAVVALANLVTGVKGNAESSYRTGNVNITPANIGAVALNGSTTMTGQLNLIPAGLEGGQILLGAPSDHPEYAGINIDQVGPSTLRIFGNPSADGTSFTGVGATLYINPYAQIITGDYTFTGNAANVTGTVQIDHGGTGKTTNWEGLAALSTPRGNTTWKDAPVGVSVFKYENNFPSFDAPGNVFVVVIKESNARGVAYAIQWANPSTALWINYLHDDSGQNDWSGWKTIVDTNGAVPVTSGGTGATTPAGARANLEITPANIGAFGGDSHTKIAYITVAANSSIDVTLSVSIQNYTVLVLGPSTYANPNREGLNGQSDMYFFPKAMSASNQFSYLVPPSNSWMAWFPSPTSLHIVNGTANVMNFRIDGFN